MLETGDFSITSSYPLKKLLIRGLRLTLLVAYFLFLCAGIYAVADSPDHWRIPGFIFLPITLLLLHLWTINYIVVILIWYLAYWALASMCAYLLMKIKTPLVILLIVNNVLGIAALVLADLVIYHGWIFTDPHYDYARNWINPGMFLVSAVLISSYVSVIFHRALPRKAHRQPKSKEQTSRLPTDEEIWRE